MSDRARTRLPAVVFPQCSLTHPHGSCARPGDPCPAATQQALAAEAHAISEFEAARGAARRSCAIASYGDRHVVAHFQLE